MRQHLQTQASGFALLDKGFVLCGGVAGNLTACLRGLDVSAIRVTVFDVNNVQCFQTCVAIHFRLGCHFVGSHVSG